VPKGVVRDLSGKPIKGASVRAVNPEAYPPELTSATDDKGRFGDDRPCGRATGDS
jgi:hypothetical protein